MTQLIVDAKVKKRFISYQYQSLVGIFLGYISYYLVRNNFILSSPYLQSELNLSITQIGFISSLMFIAYGLSKGFFSVLADTGNPKYFYGFGLLACVLINIVMGFSESFYLFLILVFLLGIFQGTGAGPALVVISYWFPRNQRGRANTGWNISHNIGGGLVAPITGVALAWLGTEHWRIAIFLVPACFAMVGVVLAFILIKERPFRVGMPPVEDIYPEVEDSVHGIYIPTQSAPPGFSAFQIFYHYVLKSPHAWYLVGVVIFTYMVRFGTITWIPIYLLNVKGFSKAEMSTAFMFFEFAAIPSTLIAGWLVDRFFVGKVMKLCFFCFCIVGVSVAGYVSTDSIIIATIFAAAIGCLIYIPHALAGVQAMEVIPSFAIGSAVGLCGFMAYIVGTSLGTTLFGFLVDNFGWASGFYAIYTGTLLGLIFCWLSHSQRKNIVVQATSQC